MKVLKITKNEKGSSFLMVSAEHAKDIMDHFEIGDICTLECLDVSEEEYNQLPEFEGFLT